MCIRDRAMSCPQCGPSRVMTTVCPGCGGPLSFGSRGGDQYPPQQSMMQMPQRPMMQMPSQRPMQRMPSQEQPVMQMPIQESQFRPPCSSRMFNFEFTLDDFDDRDRLTHEALRREIRNQNVSRTFLEGGLERCVTDMANRQFKREDLGMRDSANIFSATLFVTVHDRDGDNEERQLDSLGALTEAEQWRREEEGMELLNSLCLGQREELEELMMLRLDSDLERIASYHSQERSSRSGTSSSEDEYEDTRT
eukprot:TRINITY_DN6876_c0_g1_i1.p1 TRINITY_DN6876_c0_g1~~TRINITY_DN6876_c0_g1_i1.p1  ORF type:complete len:251 (-),score=47.96 TRINITY_DN6876_c0_g1_i1:144-896(-)